MSFIAHSADQFGNRSQVELTLQDRSVFDAHGNLIDDDGEGDVLENDELRVEELRKFNERKIQIQRNRGYDVQQSLLSGVDDDVVLPQYDEGILDFEKSRKKVKLDSGSGSANYDNDNDRQHDDNDGRSSRHARPMLVHVSRPIAPLNFQKDFAEQHKTKVAVGVVPGAVSSVVFGGKNSKQQQQRSVCMPNLRKGSSSSLASSASALHVRDHSKAAVDAEATALLTIQRKAERYKEAKERAQAQRNRCLDVSLDHSIHDNGGDIDGGDNDDGVVVSSGGGGLAPALAEYLNKINQADDFGDSDEDEDGKPSEKMDDTTTATTTAPQSGVGRALRLEDQDYANRLKEALGGEGPEAARNFHRQQRSMFAMLEVLQEEGEEIAREEKRAMKAQQKAKQVEKAKKQ